MLDHPRCGRGLCYSVNPNGDVVEQSRSKVGKLQ